MEEDANVIIAKCVLLLIMLIVSAIFVALPIGVMQIRRVKEGDATRRKFILSLLNCFGGGIFVATGFLHLLLEANGKMDTAFDELFHQEQDYPFAYFVVCIGFLMVLSIEHVVLSCVRNQPKVVVNEPNCRCETIIRSGLPGVTATGLFSQSLITTRLKPPHAIRRTKTSPDLSSSICDSIRSSSPLMNAADCTGTNNECQDKKGCIKDSDKQSITYSEDKSYSQSQVMIVTDKGTLHAFTVALALSVHSIFEGLAFGLQNSTSQMLQVFVAIIIHKAILAFSLGINFITVQVSLKISVLLTVIFCVASPIGGAIGTSLVASDSESVAVTLLTAILQGMATGTFLYIAFIEVISYELTNLEPQYASHRLLLVLSILIGFSTFAGLSFIHDH